MKRTKASVAVSTLFLAASAGLAQEWSHVRVDAPNAPELAHELESLGLDIPCGGVGDGLFEVVCSPWSLEFLRFMGLDPVVLSTSRPYSEIQREWQVKNAGPGDPVPPGYPNLTEVYAAMNAAAAAYPQICKVVNLTTTYGTPATHEGRPIYAIKISDNVNADEDEPNILVVATEHVREIVTPVISLDIINRLTTQYATSAQIRTIVDSNEVWLIPIVNPDGYVYVFDVNNLWRKNRRPFTGGTGVDLNRNFPFGWTASCAGSGSPSSDTYKGPGAGSEAETQTIMAFANDRRFAKVQDYHSYGREVLWEYACLSHPFASHWQSEATSNAALMTGYQNRAPSAEGEHYEWHLSRGAFAFLTETEASFQPAYTAAQAEANRAWFGMLAILERPIPLWGRVTDEVSGEPVVAAITYDGVTFTNGETNASAARFGRYHCFLPAGARTVRFAAAGYQTAAAPVTVSLSSSLQRDVQLRRTCYADCDLSTGAGTLDIFDFLCFQNSFAANAGYACRCDESTGVGVCDIFDFLCFQNAFAAGCP